MTRYETLVAQWRRNLPPGLVVGGGLIVALTLIALFAPQLAPHNPATLFPNGLTAAGTPLPPSRVFPLGTDAYGRDELSRLLYGGRVTLLIAGVSGFFATAIGTVVGIASAYWEGFWGNLIARFTDIVMSLPVTLLAIAMVMVTEPNLGSLIGVIVFVSWSYTARLIRQEVLTIREAEYVAMARALGARDLRVMAVHVLPQVIRTAVARFTLTVSQVVLLASGLSFLGAGVQSPQVDWGLMIAQAQNYYSSDPSLMFWPGLAIILTVAAFSMTGEALAEQLSRTPKVRR